MSTLREWAAQWNIPIAAVVDLERRMGVWSGESLTPPDMHTGAPGSEARQTSLVRLEAAKLGWHLWRNNRGAYMDDRGVQIRYGLANDSKEMNKRIKSSDWIGIRPRLILPNMVGQIIGQFTCREIKPANWVYNPNDEHAFRQNKWNELILSLGGDASFATGPGTLI